MPKVTVIIPTYNRCNLLLEAINSVIAQSHKDFELLIIDDGSTDNTRQKIAEIRDNRIKYIYKNNGGVASARNLGLKNAQGESICFLDSDDLWPADYLKTMIDSLQENQQYGAAYCMRTMLYKNGLIKASYQDKFFHSGQITQQLFQKTFIQTSAICFRRKNLQGIFFDESLTNGEDVDLWLRVSTKTEFLFVPNTQIIYRPQEPSSEMLDFTPNRCNRIRVLERFYFKLGGDKHIPHKIAMRKLSNACRSAAKEAINDSCRKAAIDLLGKAIQYEKWQPRLYLDLLKAYSINKKNDKMPNWQMPKPLEINKNYIAGGSVNIVTASDNNFYHCLKELADSVRHFYNKPIIVYDIGLTDEQKKQLDAVIIPIEISEKVNHKGKSLLAPSGIPSTRATHKPFCVRHYFKNYSEPMIMVDADCLFTTKVEETGFDVGVTFYKSKNKNIDYYNGVINSGVIFFNSPAEKLVDAWAIECEKEKTTDQKALSDVLSQTINWKISDKTHDWNGLKIKIFDARIYNDYHLTDKGKILHFINTKHDKIFFEQLMIAYKEGKDIRKLFAKVKRGKVSRTERILNKIKSIFSNQENKL